jgi:hypothetical protein
MDRFSQVLEFRIREGFRIDGIGTGLLGFLDFDEFFWYRGIRGHG